MRTRGCDTALGLNGGGKGSVDKKQRGQEAAWTSGSVDIRQRERGGADTRQRGVAAERRGARLCVRVGEPDVTHRYTPLHTCVWRVGEPDVTHCYTPLHTCV